MLRRQRCVKFAICCNGTIAESKQISGYVRTSLNLARHRWRPEEPDFRRQLARCISHNVTRRFLSWPEARKLSAASLEGISAPINGRGQTRYRKLGSHCERSIIPRKTAPDLDLPSGDIAHGSGHRQQVFKIICISLSPKHLTQTSAAP